jgi:hypothetical protein
MLFPPPRYRKRIFAPSNTTNISQQPISKGKRKTIVILAIPLLIVTLLYLYVSHVLVVEKSREEEGFLRKIRPDVSVYTSTENLIDTSSLRDFQTSSFSSFEKLCGSKKSTLSPAHCEASDLHTDFGVSFTCFKSVDTGSSDIFLEYPKKLGLHSPAVGNKIPFAFVDGKIASLLANEICDLFCR